MASSLNFSTSSNMVPPRVEKNTQASTSSTETKGQVSSNPDQASQVKIAAMNLAIYMENLYGKVSPDAGWNEDAMKVLADGKSFHSPLLGKEISAPKEVQDSIKMLLATGDLSKSDLNRDGFFRPKELKEYANFASGSSDKI